MRQKRKSPACDRSQTPGGSRKSKRVGTWEGADDARDFDPESTADSIGGTHE